MFDEKVISLDVLKLTKSMGYVKGQEFDFKSASSTNSSIIDGILKQGTMDIIREKSYTVCSNYDEIGKALQKNIN